jgi:hypothetical protein
MEMDEMLSVVHLLDLEKERDVLDDQVGLMEQMLYGRIGKILSVVVMWLVFEHTLYDNVYTNFFHLSYCLLLLLKK